jgi:hypothetical protein
MNAPAPWISGAKEEAHGYDLVPRLDFIPEARLLAGFRFGTLVAAIARRGRARRCVWDLDSFLGTASPALAATASLTEDRLPVAPWVTLTNVAAARPSFRATALRRGSCPGSFFVFAIASSRILITFRHPIRIRTKRSPGCKPGLLRNYASQLGSAALTVVLFFVLTLAALFVGVIPLLLTALLSTLLAGLTGLAALLTGLAALLTLSGLSTLLLPVHIVCHGYTPSNAAQALRIYRYL